MEKVKSLLNPKNLVQNSFVFAILAIFLTMYGPRLHPALPMSLRNLFNNPLFRGLVIFLIVYLANRNLTMSLTITIVFLVTMSLVNREELMEQLRNKEHFYTSVNGPPVSNCNNYDLEKMKKDGTPFYPLNGKEDLLN